MIEHSKNRTIRTKPFFRIFFLILLITLLASCASKEGIIVEGRYSTSFEVSVFMPCRTNNQKELWESANKNTVYWLTSTPTSHFSEQLKSYYSLMEPTGELNMYVKFIGDISPTKKNGYGHLGMYSNQVTVTEVVEMEPWVDRQCPLE